jgi:hypothetical protein
MAQTTHPPARHEETAAERQERASAEEKATRDAAEAATAHMPTPGGGPVQHLTAADVAKEGEKTTKLLFAHQVWITLPGYRVVHFPAGLQDVPGSLVEEYAEEFKNSNAVPAS